MQTSEATARRHTYQMGQAACAVQQSVSKETRPGATVPEKRVVSPDGAMVPLGGGPWAEGKTVVAGEVVTQGCPPETHRMHRSSFSRMTDAQTFTEQASDEWLRRGIDHARQVCTVRDGTEWMDGLLDWQCPNAWRVLDVTPAAASVSAIEPLVQTAGSASAC